MPRASRRIIVVVMLLATGAPTSLGAADSLLDSLSTILRARLQQEIIEELREHGSEATAWYNEKSVDKQKWTQGKILGRPIRLASWTEETKSWIWLEDPDHTLSFELRRLAARDGRIEFSVVARAVARFKIYRRVPKLAKAAVGGNMDIELAIDGSAAIGGGGLQDAKITNFGARVHDLRFNNDLAHVWEDLSKDALNSYVRGHQEKLTQSVENAINRVKFSHAADRG